MKTEKYTLKIQDDAQELEMPQGAHIVGVKASAYRVELHAVVNPKADKQKRRFVVRETGLSVPPFKKHVGCAPHGQTVLHVFEVAK